MSYLVLARKWRPQKWNEVVAQEPITATLQNAIKLNRLAHSYLFTGPRGVGKTSVARILAKTLNCEKGPTSDPCDACSNCHEIAESRSVDVFEIDGASNRGIDEVRNLRENIRYTPAKGKYRIYIIDEVHMLTNEAFNALLKTLEEPPDHVLFIFATTEPHKVPATIVSRCQRFDFRRISIQNIVHHLKRICQEEKIDIEEEALLIIARKADGSFRDSQSILDQMISYTGEKISAEDIVQALGLIEQELFFEVTDVLISGEIKKGLSLIDRVILGGYDLEEFLSSLAEHFRNLLVTKATGSAETVNVSEVHKKRYMETAQQFREEDLLRLIRIVLDASNSLKRSTNPRLPLELAMVKMVKMDRTIVIQDLLDRLAEKKNERVTGEIVERSASRQSEEIPVYSQNKPEERPVHIPLTLDKIQNLWNEIINKVKEKKITVGSFLQEGILLGINGDKLEIGFGLSNGFHIDAIVRSQAMVTSVLNEVLGETVQFRCVKGDFEQKKKTVSPTVQRTEDLKQLAEKDEIVKKLIEDFDIEIVE